MPIPGPFQPVMAAHPHPRPGLHAPSQPQHPGPPPQHLPTPAQVQAAALQATAKLVSLGRYASFGSVVGMVLTDYGISDWLQLGLGPSPLVVPCLSYLWTVEQQVRAALSSSRQAPVLQYPPPVIFLLPRPIRLCLPSSESLPRSHTHTHTHRERTESTGHASHLSATIVCFSSARFCLPRITCVTPQHAKETSFASSARPWVPLRSELPWVGGGHFSW